MASALVELFAHNLWANLRLLTICSALSDEHLDATSPGTYGSVRNTLWHILANEEFYAALLSRRQPSNPLFSFQSFPGFEELAERARRSGLSLIQVAARSRPNRVLKGAWQGQPYAMPASVPLIQAVNHATEHRGHVVSIISQRGIVVPRIDAWAYWREQTHTHSHDHEH